LYAAAMGVSGGAITMVFFAFWAHAYGRAHVGTIISVAQAMTVLGSGLGQILPALSVKEAGSYMPLFLATSPLVAVLGICCWLVPVPSPSDLAATAQPSSLVPLSEGAI